jgi:hypothetical protein
LNSTGGVSNYRESWHGVDAGGPTWRRSHRFLLSFLSPGSQYKPISLKSRHGIGLPSRRIYTFPSFCGRFDCPSTISITPSLFHDPTAIEAPIISDGSRARLAVRSKPVRLNMRSGSNDIGGIVIKSRAMRASRGYRVPFTQACQYAIGSVH